MTKETFSDMKYIFFFVFFSTSGAGKVAYKRKKKDN